MICEAIEANWKQANGKVKQQWGKLTNDQVDLKSGKRSQLVGKIQECYGIASDEAERLVADWEAQYGDTFDKAARDREKCRREAALSAALDSIGRF
jgi:uncharacterized protein YjbJ (UPF0337 family)